MLVDELPNRQPILLATQEAYESARIQLRLGVPAVGVDCAGRRVLPGNGQEEPYRCGELWGYASP